MINWYRHIILQRMIILYIYQVSSETIECLDFLEKNVKILIPLQLY